MIPRPVIGAAPWHRRAEALAWCAVARAIEFTLGVLNGIAYPVQRGTPSLLRGGPVILVANHRSLLDTTFIRWSLHPGIRKPLVTVGGFDFFEPRGTPWQRLVSTIWLRFIVDGYRVWMIDRRIEGSAHLGQLASLLAAGRTLLLYPEGRRSRSARMGPMQPGAAILARREGVPVVPIFVGGTETILPPGRFWPQPGPLRIRMGAPMRPEALEHPEDFMQRVRGAIAALSNGQEAAS